ncbi:hypothetical protein FQR65_LT05478 [Abscondita terminalis]|nr:hypothetical protein FQR65_LT05478 [Abscondita terminalis]
MLSITRKTFYFTVCVTIVTLIVLLKSDNHIIRSKRIFINETIQRKAEQNINCFKAFNNTLTNLLTVQPNWKKSIYFMEVSCLSSRNGRISILPRQACAIESAAVTNPDYDVYVLFASRGVIEDQGSLSDYLINILLSYHNVKFLHIDMDSLIHGSIVERLYREQKVQKSVYPMNINGNIMRLLVLQKYGGLYLDLDVIVLTNFDVLPSNLVGIQSKIAINNAVMRVDDGDVGKNFTKLCLEEIRDHPFGRVWGNTGPRVITKVMKRMCQVNNIKLMPNRSCSGVHVLPSDKFYPVHWLESQKIFETQKSDYLLNKILNTSIVLHLWNKFSHGFVASEAPNSIYNTLANKFCPLVYDVAKNYF